MSLLLDALKKSSSGQNAPSEPPRPSSGAPLEFAPEPAPQQPPKATISKSEPARSSGKNLFAAKSKPARARGAIKLGIVPIAVISGLLIGGAYGFYVWWQITPHPVTPRPAPPAPPPVVAAPQPVVAAPPPPVMQTETAPVQAASKVAPAPTAHRHMARKQATGLQLEKQAVDTLTPLLQAAYQAYRSGDLNSARQNYAAALKQDANNRDALLGMAAIAQQQGQDALAAQYYGHLLAQDPRDPLAHAGMSALSKDSAVNNESRIKLLLEQQPQAAALHFALGNLYAEQSRWGEAQQAYFDAYSLQPDAGQFAFNLAISLDHLGQSKQAAQYYQRALQLDNQGNATFDHGQAQQRLNELKAPR